MQIINEWLEKLFIRLGMRFYRFIHICSDENIVEAITFSRDKKYIERIKKLSKTSKDITEYFSSNI